MLDCDTIVSEFKPELCNYVHFLINPMRKDINLLVPPAMV